MPRDPRFIWDALILLVFGLSSVYVLWLYVRLLAVSVQRLRGGWRIAAFLPLLVVIPVLIGTILAWLQGYNVWLFFVLIGPAWLVLYHILLLALHRWVARR